MCCELGRGVAGADVQGYDWGFQVTMCTFICQKACAPIWLTDTSTPNKTRLTRRNWSAQQVSPLPWPFRPPLPLAHRPRPSPPPPRRRRCRHLPSRRRRTRPPLRPRCALRGPSFARCLCRRLLESFCCFNCLMSYKWKKKTWPN